jgi:hypothetical protein
MVELVVDCIEDHGDDGVENRGNDGVEDHGDGKVEDHGDEGSKIMAMARSNFLTT